MNKKLKCSLLFLMLVIELGSASWLNSPAFAGDRISPASSIHPSIADSPAFGKKYEKAAQASKMVPFVAEVKTFGVPAPEIFRGECRVVEIILLESGDSANKKKELFCFQDFDGYYTRLDWTLRRCRWFRVKDFADPKNSEGKKIIRGFDLDGKCIYYLEWEGFKH